LSNWLGSHCCNSSRLCHRIPGLSLCLIDASAHVAELFAEVLVALADLLEKLIHLFLQSLVLRLQLRDPVFQSLVLLVRGLQVGLKSADLPFELVDLVFESRL